MIVFPVLFNSNFLRTLHLAITANYPWELDRRPGPGGKWLNAEEIRDPENL